MSNRSFATRYDGSSSAPHSSGGGADLFGLQAKRQKDIMALQQAQELEKMREAERLQEQGTSQEGNIAKEKSRFDAAVDILKQNRMIPTDANIKSYDDATTQQRLQIAKTENDIEQAQSTSKLNFLQSKPGQSGMDSANAAILAKPGVDNSEGLARAQALSTTTVPPNTGVRIGAPGGDFSAKPQDLYGATQKTEMVGGIPDTNPASPTYGQKLFGKPVETYGKASFPPIANLRPQNGDSQNLTNNVSAKLTDSNIAPSGQPAQPDLASRFGMQFAPQQPTVGGMPDVLTKPQQSDPGTGISNVGGASPMDAIKALIQMFKMQPGQKPFQVPGTPPNGLY